MDSKILNIAKEELLRAKIPLPIELIEALIWTESRGKIGLVNPNSGASGLMQVMPKSLEWYRQSTKDKTISLDDLRRGEKDAFPESFARKQIKVGLWILAQYWKTMYKYLRSKNGVVPIDELARMADLAYVAGAGALKKRLDSMPVVSYGAVLSTYPNWNAIPHPQHVFSYHKETGWIDNSWDLVAIDKWLRGSPLIATLDNPITGFVIAGVVIAVASHLFKKGKEAEE